MADHDSPVRLLAFSARSRHFTTAFRSLTGTARFRATLARSMLPACRFNAVPNGVSGPFGWLLLPPRGFAFRPVEINTANPFPGFPSGTFGPASVSTPLLGF